MLQSNQEAEERKKKVEAMKERDIENFKKNRWELV